MTKKQTEGESFVGHYFHEIDVDDKMKTQGVVIANPEPGWYLVQLFEWLHGNPTSRHLVRIEDMRSWCFYEDSEAMKSAYRAIAA